MNLKDKKVVFLGDSITQGACATADEKIFHQVMKRELGMKEALNYGLGGTRIARQIGSYSSIWDYDFIMRADVMPLDADCVIVLGGTNDFGHGTAPMGKPDGDDIFTFYGAVNVLFKKLIDKYGKDKIVVMTPIHRADETLTMLKGGVMTEAHLSEYVDILRAKIKEFGLKSIDLYACDELNPNNPEINAKYFQDGLHPNDAGHELLAHVIEKEIEKL